MPLQLHSSGMWDPNKQYWGEPAYWSDKDGEYADGGWDPDNWDDDPIVNAVNLRNRGDAGPPGIF